MIEKITLKDSNNGNIAYPYTTDELVLRTGGTNVKNTLDSLEGRVTSTNAQLATKANKSYVNDRLDTQDQKINLLDGHEVVAVVDHTAVTNPDSQKIYREPGDDSYTDWMYQDSTWYEMAEYPVPISADAIIDENLNKTQE